jgi:hypothetical protein
MEQKIIHYTLVLVKLKVWCHKIQQNDTLSNDKFNRIENNPLYPGLVKWDLVVQHSAEWHF